MRPYLHAAAGGVDFLGLLISDDDTIPCVHREWRLEQLDEEVITLASRARLTVGAAMTETVRWLGATVPDLSLECRHSSSQVQLKLYDRDKLTKEAEQVTEESQER